MLAPGYLAPDCSTGVGQDKVPPCSAVQTRYNKTLRERRSTYKQHNRFVLLNGRMYRTPIADISKRWPAGENRGIAGPPKETTVKFIIHRLRGLGRNVVIQRAIMNNNSNTKTNVVLINQINSINVGRRRVRAVGPPRRRSAVAPHPLPLHLTPVENRTCEYDTA